MTDELEHLDRLLDQLDSILDVPGEDEESNPEMTWQKLEVLDASMGEEALRALLLRQGMDRAGVKAAFEVLASRQAGWGSDSL